MTVSATPAPDASDQAAAKKHPPTWVIASAVGLLVALVVGLFASAFIWPLKASDPRDIPFGIAGPAERVTQIKEQLSSAQPDLFEVTNFDDRDAVVQAIKAREIDGGLVASESGVEVLTASAGNAQVAQMLTQLAAGMKEQQAAAAQQAINDAVAAAKQQGASAEQILAMQEQAQAKAAAVTVTTTDVVSGGTLAAAANLVMLPALIGGMMTAVLSVFVVKRPWYRIISVLSGSLFAGLAGALVLGPWFDVLPGSFGMNWLALSGGVLAIAATITGLGTLLGPAGIGLGVILMMLIGNPWGGMLVPSEFLGGFMGWLGANMPNGNVIQLIKNINYFPDASLTSHWWVMAVWTAIGLLLWLLGAAIRSGRGNESTLSAA